MYVYVYICIYLKRTSGKIGLILLSNPSSFICCEDKMITVMTNKHKRRSKKCKESNQSATDENEDDSFGDLSLDMSHDMSDGPDSGQPDEQSVTDGAATGTDVKGSGDKTTSRALCCRH